AGPRTRPPPASSASGCVPIDAGSPNSWMHSARTRASRPASVPGNWGSSNDSGPSCDRVRLAAYAPQVSAVVPSARSRALRRNVSGSAVPEPDSYCRSMTSSPDLGAEADPAARIAAHVRADADRLDAFSRDLYDHPELGYHEFHAVDAFAAELEAAGIPITRATAGIPTAFTAQLGDPDSGPQVAITAEHDALPGVAHGCGPSGVAASSLGAFRALEPRFDGEDPRPGGVTLIGTPAEEGGGGKELLIQAGAFDGYDAAVMVHPGNRDIAAAA